MLLNLKELEEEEPELHIVWEERLCEIHAQLMGEVQIQILHELILERFGVDVTFGEGNIVYKETITNRVEGVGHYEPLRHYAEVHLIMERASREVVLHLIRSAVRMIWSGTGRDLFSHIWKKENTEACCLVRQSQI